jgi:AcrR family transcriptional regulator
MHRTMPSAIPNVERGKHDKDQRQICLIEAATQVFAEKGFDQATTREVAERAGCSEGLIHRYFGSKRGLLIAILDRKAETIRAERVDGLPMCETIEGEIEQLVIWPMDQYWERREFMRVGISQAAIDRDVGHTIGDRVNHVHVAFMAERLRAHQAAGRIAPDLDVDAVAMGISGLNLSMGFFAQVAFDMDRARCRRQAKEMARVIARGLMPHATGDRPANTARAGRTARGDSSEDN